MQTFLPYPDFSKSASVLDRQRLGKQRVEAFQILKILLGKGNITKTGKIAWSSHPAVHMWKDYEFALLLYTCAICNEWVRRGYKDTVKNKSMDLFISTHTEKELENYFSKELPVTYPKWFSSNNFHSSHRSNLLRKANEALEKSKTAVTEKKKQEYFNVYKWYMDMNWSEPSSLPYIWPSNEN